MKHSSMNNQRVIAIAPCAAGFGFVVLEGSERLIDYGVKGAQGNKNNVCLKKIAELIEYYQPEVIVLENPADKACRRCRRVQELLRAILNLTLIKKVTVRTVSQLQIKKVFSPEDSSTKYQMAYAIVKQFPELAVRLPPLRKPWMTEDKRMSIFKAMALALTCFLEKQT